MLDRSAEAYREDRSYPRWREMASLHSLSLLASQDLPSPLELFSLRPTFALGRAGDLETAMEQV